MVPKNGGKSGQVEYGSSKQVGGSVGEDGQGVTTKGGLSYGENEYTGKELG